MVNSNFKKIILLFAVIFLIGFVSAEVRIGNLNHSITTSYGPNENIKGWVNISLVDELTNSTLYGFIDGVKDSINLFELIKKISNSNFIYSCDPHDCKSDYITNIKESSKIFDLGYKESTSIGLKITSSQLITDVSSFSIKVASNNEVETSRPPLLIDVLNDGIIDFESNSPSKNFNMKNSGCYIDSTNNKEAGIITTKYCEKVSLLAGPKTEIGAEVIGTENVNFIMSLEEIGGSFEETCSATATESGEIKCSPDDSAIERGDYFVCIRTADLDDNDKYKIKYEEYNPCGFSGYYSGAYKYDFNLFGRSGKYAIMDNVILNDESIRADIENYLFTKYENNCTKGCIIPIKFISGVNQKLTLTEPTLNYVSGISTGESSLYNLEEISAKINSQFQKLYLDEALFNLPWTYGNHTLSVKLNEKELFSKKILVESVPTIKFLTPISTAAGYQTNFIVYTNWSSDITKYFWDFGDNTNKTTTENKVSHVYSSKGTYKVKIIVSDEEEKSGSRTFQVSVLSASEIVPPLLNQAILNVKKIKEQLKNFSKFEEDSIIYTLKLNETEKMVSDFNKSISKTISEDEYGKIFEQLLLRNIPQSIEKTVIANGILFYPQLKNIDLIALEEIGGGNYSNEYEEDYKNAVLVWYNENIETTMDYKEISAYYGRYALPLVNTFDIQITNLGAGDNYIIFKKLEDLFYDKDYSQSEWGSYNYIKLNELEKEIAFSTSEEVNFETLPLFIAPKISELVITREITSFEETSKKWVIFGIIVVGIIIVSIIVWMIIRLWYKKKYETYLFKDRNNLYNIISYIDGEKKKGTKESEILAKLKKAGWNAEQIRYSLKKYSWKK